MAKWRLRVFWALALAIMTFAAAKSYLGSLEETAPLIITTGEIPARAQITEDMVKVIEVKQSDRERIAPDGFSSLDEVLGLYARQAIPGGEILHNRRSDLTDREIRPANYPGEGALAEFLPSGTRAVTVKLDQEGVLGRHTQTGDQVDVVFTSKDDGTGGVYASLVVQQVVVLHVEHNPEMPDEVLATLLVTPEQAVQIALAKRTGDLDLVLAPPDAGEPIEVHAVSPLVFTGQTEASPLPAGQDHIGEDNAAAATSAQGKGE